jgi:hypothetical protein
VASARRRAARSATRAGSGDTPRLAEIPEAAADGLVADVYDRIRRVTGVPTVAFVYRALALEPRVLAAAWSDLAPNVADRDVRAAAETLGASLAFDVSALAPHAVPVDRVSAARTLGAFDRMNRLNLVGLTALLEGRAAPAAPAPPSDAADPIGVGLAMADLASLPPETLELLEEMSMPVSGAARPILVPSLYRFFASDHDVLAGLWEAIRPTVESDAFGRSAAGLRADARVVGGGLPYGIRRLEHEASRAVVARFLETIPAMIVVTGLLRDALGCGR